MSNTCNCKHNHTPKPDEPCCRCDSRDAKDDNVVNKVSSLEIIVRMIEALL